jgi:hypothetical protein
MVADLCVYTSMTLNLGATNCQGPITDATDVVVGNTTTSYTSSFLGIAPLMLIAWESSDMAVFTPPSAPLLQVVAATATSVNSTSASDSTTSATSVNTDTLPVSELAQEAKIGIGVGTACGVLLVCTSIGMLIYRRRVRRSREKSKIGQAAGETDGAGIVAKAELAGDSHVREIDIREVYAETDDANARHELEGDWHGYEVRGA